MNEYSAHQLRNLHQFDTYIKHALSNYAKKRKQKEQRISSHEVFFEDFMPNQSISLSYLDTYHIPTQCITIHGQHFFIENDDLLQRIRQLAPNEQRLLFHVYWDDLQDKEIADLYNTTPNAIKKRRQRILKKMRNFRCHGGDKDEP